MLGHQTATAYTGRAALEIAPKFAPEAAFVSIRLPGGMDGYELARRLRGGPPAAGRPGLLVALTGHREPPPTAPRGRGRVRPPLHQARGPERPGRLCSTPYPARPNPP